MTTNEKRLIDAAWALVSEGMEMPAGAEFNRANLAEVWQRCDDNYSREPNDGRRRVFGLINALEACLAESERSEVVPGEYIVDYGPWPHGIHGIVMLRRVSVYEVGGKLFWNFAGKSTVNRAEDCPLVNPRKIA